MSGPEAGHIGMDLAAGRLEAPSDKSVRALSAEVARPEGFEPPTC